MVVEGEGAVVMRPHPRRHCLWRATWSGTSYRLV